jgi:hypothetical protein
MTAAKKPHFLARMGLAREVPETDEDTHDPESASRRDTEPLPDIPMDPNLTPPPVEHHADTVPQQADVEKAKAFLTAKVVYGSSPVLIAFKRQWDALSMLPPDTRMQAAIATTTGFDKATIQQAMGEAANALEIHAKSYVADLGKAEREEISGRTSRRDAIDTQLAKLQQDMARLNDDKAKVIAEIDEKERAFAVQRSTYELANQLVAEEVTALRTALGK